MKMPLFGATYFATAVFCASTGLLAQTMRPLRALGILVLVVSAFNIYVELWRSSYMYSFIMIAAVLSICFLVAHTEWTISLMRSVVSGKRSHLYVITFVPLIWMFGASVLLLLPQFQRLENPPAAVYAFLALMSTLQVPAFTAGKDRILNTVDKSSLPSAPDNSSSFFLAVSVFLLLPTLITFFIQMRTRDDWTMFSLNVVFAGANLALAIISRRRAAGSPSPSNIK